MRHFGRALEKMEVGTVSIKPVASLHLHQLESLITYAGNSPHSG